MPPLSQLQAGVAPGDTRIGAATTPVRRRPGRRRGGSRWIPVVVVMVVVVVLGVVRAVMVTEATKAKAVPCRLAEARTTLTFKFIRDAQGGYGVTATGTTVNESSRPLHDVVVTWVVSYANGSTSKTTATLLPNKGTIAEGATSSWSGSSSTNDGRARPTAVKVLHTYTTVAHPTCLT
jgi:hypothetical protein